MKRSRYIYLIFIVILAAVISSLSTWVILSMKTDPYKSFEKFSKEFYKEFSEKIEHPQEITSYDMKSMPDELKKELDEATTPFIRALLDLGEELSQYEIKVKQRRNISNIYLLNVELMKNGVS